MMNQSLASGLIDRKVAFSLCFGLVMAAILASAPLVHAQSSDFTVDANPHTLCVNPGINARTVISLASVGGFSGSISLGDSVSPVYNNGPTLSAIPSSENLASGQTVSFDLTILTTSASPVFTYYITVVGVSGSTYHQTNIQLAISTDCSVGGTIVAQTASDGIGQMVGLAVGITGAIGALVAVVARKHWSSSRLKLVE